VIQQHNVDTNQFKYKPIQMYTKFKTQYFMMEVTARTEVFNFKNNNEN